MVATRGRCHSAPRSTLSNFGTTSASLRAGTDGRRRGEPPWATVQYRCTYSGSRKGSLSFEPLRAEPSSTCRQQVRCRQAGVGKISNLAQIPMRSSRCFGANTNSQGFVLQEVCKIKLDKQYDREYNRITGRGLFQMGNKPMPALGGAHRERIE